MLYKEFGNFNSAEEINEKAAELLAAGDTDAVRRLAKENGLDSYEADDYFINGDADRFCTELMAALGKLDVEEKNLKIGGVLSEWTTYIKEMCMEKADIAKAIREKKRSLAECMARLIRFSFENKVRVSDQIVDITKVTHNGKEVKIDKPLYLGIPDRVTAKKIIREYYLGR